MGLVKTIQDLSKLGLPSSRTDFKNRVDNIFEENLGYSIVDNLTSTDLDKSLSANQGKIIKDLIDGINSILVSDDVTLDQLQEIVVYIKENRKDIDSLSINSIIGLQDALNLKVDKVSSKSLVSDSLISKLEALRTNSQLTIDLDTKVDKEEGKSLILNSDLAKLQSIPTTFYVRDGKVRRVDATTGDDTGDGVLQPYKTLAKAFLAVQSGEEIIVAPGTYTESATLNTQNVTISALGNEDGGLVNVVGTINIAPTGSSTRINGLSISTLVHSGAGGLYLKDSKVPTALNLTGGGYFESKHSDLQGATFTALTTISGSGSKNFYSCHNGLMSITNASAVVAIVNPLSASAITQSNGILAVSGGGVYASSSTTNAIASTGGVLYLDNAAILNPDGTQGKISIGAAVAYSLNNTRFNKASSTISGTNLATAKYFDAISINDSSVAYGLFAPLVRDASGKVVSQPFTAKSVAVLDVLNTPATVANYGDTWLVGGSPTGAFAGKADNYATFVGTGYVFAAPSVGNTVLIQTGTSAGTVLQYISSNAWTTLGSIGSVMAWNGGNAYGTGSLVQYGNILYASNSSVPANTPFVVDNSGTSGATWHSLDFASGVAITGIANQTANYSIPVATLDLGHAIELAQTTANITFAVPNPKTVGLNKLLYFVNKGTVATTLTYTGGSYSLAANSISYLLWDGSAWFAPAAGGGSSGGLSRSVIEMTTDTTAGSTSNTDYVYNCTSPTDIALTLPAGATGLTNLYTVLQSNVGVVTVTAKGADLIAGSATFTTTGQYSSYSFIWNGTSWSVL